MNDRKKTVLLLLLIFSVFGLVGWRVAGVPSQVTPPSGLTSTTLDSNGQPVATDSNTVNFTASPGTGKASGTAAKPITVAAPTAVAGPDPFRTAATTGPTSKIPPEIAALPKPVVPRTGAAIRGSDLDQPVSPLKGEILPTPGASSVEVRSDPALALKVSGVLTGDKPVAIIRLGDQQFVVSPGDVFGDGYVLKSVTTTQVEVVQGKKKIFLPTMGA